MLAWLTALAILASAQAAPSRPIVPIDQPTWKSLIAKALAQKPRDESGMFVYELDNRAAVTSSPCPAGTAPENRFEIFQLKNNRYPLMADVDIEVICTDPRGFLAAGLFIQARSDDRTIRSESMFTGDPDRKKATKVIIDDGQPRAAGADVPALRAAVTAALRSLNSP